MAVHLPKKTDRDVDHRGHDHEGQRNLQGAQGEQVRDERDHPQAGNEDDQDHHSVADQVLCGGLNAHPGSPAMKDQVRRGLLGKPLQAAPDRYGGREAERQGRECDGLGHHSLGDAQRAGDVG